LLPWGNEPVDLERLRRETYAYVAYNPFGRRCRGDAVPLADWHADWMRVCRVGMQDLIARRDTILESHNPASHDATQAALSDADQPFHPAQGGHLDEILADLQTRLGSGAWPPSRAELMALARVVRTRGWSDDAFLRRLLERVSDTP